MIALSPLQSLGFLIPLLLFFPAPFPPFMANKVFLPTRSIFPGSRVTSRVFSRTVRGDPMRETQIAFYERRK